MVCLFFSTNFNFFFLSLNIHTTHTYTHIQTHKHLETILCILSSVYYLVRQAGESGVNCKRIGKFFLRNELKDSLFILRGKEIAKKKKVSLS